MLRSLFALTAVLAVALIGLAGLVGFFKPLPATAPTATMQAVFDASPAVVSPPVTEAMIRALIDAPRMVGTYGPTMPAIRLPAGDVVLTAPLVFRGVYSPALIGDSVHGTRLIWDGPPGGYAVEFRGCDRPLLANLTIKFNRQGAGGVLVCNDLDAKVTNTAARIERVCIDAPDWAKVRTGIDLDNSGGGRWPDQNGEHHQVLDCTVGGVHYGVKIERTQAHRCTVRGTSFSACYYGVYARACGSQLVEGCAFANCTRCLTFGDQFGGGPVVRRVNAEGCRQLVRFWSGPGTAVLEDVRCDGMRPFAPTDLRTDGDGYDADYNTAAVMVSMSGVCHIRRVTMSAFGEQHPIRIWLGGNATDASDVQVWRGEGDPRPVVLAKHGEPRRWEFGLLGTVMKSGAQPTEPFTWWR